MGGLAREREHAEHTFVYTPQRRALDEALQRFDTQRELAERERALAGDATVTQSRQVLRRRILRTIDDAKVLGAAALHRGLHESASSVHDKIERLDGPPFAAL